MDKVRQILQAVLYCNVATVCEDGTPWNTPVFFGYNKTLKLFWRSWTESVHSLNLTMRPQAFVTVYDSGVAWGKGEGVYIQGTVNTLEDKKDITEALDYLNARSSKVSSAAEFMNDNPRRIYELTPEKIWINADSEINGKFIDTRERIL